MKWLSVSTKKKFPELEDKDIFFTDKDGTILEEWIKCGYQYRRGFMICSGKTNDMPRFEKILEIVMVSNKNIFITQVWETVKFSKKLNAYKLCSVNNKNVLDLQLLVYKEPFELHQTHSESCSQFYLVPKYTFIF